MVVQFDSRDGCARFGQGLGQGADARPDFQDRIALPDFGSVGNVVDDGVTDEEILAQLLIHAQAKAVDDVADDVGIGQVDFFHLFHLVDLTEGIIPFVTGDAVMVQAFQKLFGIAIADTQDSADFGPAVGRIRRPVEAGSGNVLHGKGRLRFIRRTADFGQGQADDFRRGLFDAQVVVGNGIFPGIKACLALGKRSVRNLRICSPARSGSGQDDDAPLFIGTADRVPACEASN